MLPVLNAEAVRMAVKFGLAIDARIARRSVFARKNYFYPDLPKGYQISQYELPIVAEGAHGHRARGRHASSASASRARTWRRMPASRCTRACRALSGIDLNRAGTPLIEIVSEPDMRSAKEAVAYLKKIHTLVRYLEICDGNMQEGSFRCDANVSVRRRGAEKFGTRAEIKNLNSFRFVEKAINYEVARQIDMHRSRAARWCRRRACTTRTRARRARCAPRKRRTTTATSRIRTCCRWRSMRRSSTRWRATLPELPDQKAARFAAAYGLSAYDAGVLTASRELGDYFEAVVRRFPRIRSWPPTGSWGSWPPR